MKVSIPSFCHLQNIQVQVSINFVYQGKSCLVKILVGLNAWLINTTSPSLQMLWKIVPTKDEKVDLVMGLVEVISFPVKPLFDHLLGVVDVQALVVRQLRKGVFLHVRKLLLIISIILQLQSIKLDQN